MGFHKTKVTTDENFFCGLKKKTTTLKTCKVRVHFKRIMFEIFETNFDKVLELLFSLCMLLDNVWMNTD